MGKAILGFIATTIAACFAIKWQMHSDVENAVDMDMSFVFAGDMMTELAKGARYKPKMAEMKLEYTDRPLNGRIGRYCKSLGLTAEQARAAMIESLRYFGAQRCSFQSRPGRSAKISVQSAAHNSTHY